MKYTDACWELLRHGKPITPVGYEDKVYMMKYQRPEDNAPVTFKIHIDDKGEHSFNSAKVHTTYFIHDWVEYKGYVTTKKPWE